MANKLRSVSKGDNPCQSIFAKHTSTSTILQIATICAFAITFSLSTVLPIYIDEIGWKILQARLFHDGFVNITLWPQCGEPFATVLPWFMVPVRVVDAWLYGDFSSPLWLRATGMLNLVIWLALVTWVLRRMLPMSLSSMALASVVVALASLGVLPFLMVLNRPEQTLLIGLTLVYLLPFVVLDQRTWICDLAYSFLVLVLIAILLAQHPKSLAFLPLIFVSIFFVMQRWHIRLIMSALVFYFSILSYSYWKNRMSCPNDVFFQHSLGTHVVSLSSLFTEPMDTIYTMIKNLARSINYFKFTFFRSYYWNDWLPPDNQEWPAYIIINILILSVFIIFGVIILVWVFRTIISFWATAKLSKHDLMIFSALVSIAILFTLQTYKNWYETCLVIPLIVLILLTITTKNIPEKLRVFAPPISNYIMTVVLISQFFLWISFVPHIGDLRQGGYLPNQSYSLSAFDYADVKRTVLQTAAMCGIESSPRTRHLVVDFLTYSTFATTYRPYEIRNITHVGGKSIWEEQPIGNVIELLRRSKSAGIVVGCHQLPVKLRDSSIQNGPFCCVPSFSP